ncbi:OsmC family protein [Sedimentitalea sp. HM32M-2]
MRTVSVNLSNIAGTEAALGWAGSHTIVADRPTGAAGGRGLGFNGAELLALALGGCFCNDLRYVAYELGASIDRLQVKVTLELEGDPLVATSARMDVICATRNKSDAAEVVRRAQSSCMVSQSLTRGVPVEIFGRA